MSRPWSFGSRSRASIEKRLLDTGARLRRCRDDLRVAQEQLDQLAHEAEDARIRALVSETPLSDRDHREAARHADAMRRYTVEVAGEIAQLEALQDQLLDDLNAATEGGAP